MSVVEKLRVMEARTITLDGQLEMRRILPQLLAVVEAAERLDEDFRRYGHISEQERVHNALSALDGALGDVT